MRTPILRRGSSVAVCCALWLFGAAPAAAQEQQPDKQEPQNKQEPQDKPIGEAPAERDAEDVFLRGQRVLLGRGDVVLDFAQFYSRSDNLQLAIVEEAVQLATSEVSVLTTALVARVGVLNETEVYAGTAYYHSKNRLVVGATDVASSGRSLLGDVSIGVRRTLLREAARRPDIVLSIDAVVPTDDDRFYVLGGGLVFVKSIDPVVLFAGTDYFHGFRRDRPDGTRIVPGNAFDISLGYGLALNDTLAISTVGTGVFVRSGLINGVERGKAETFSLRFALTSSLAKGLYIEPSVSVGLSGPGQSFAMGVTVPYSF